MVTLHELANDSSVNSWSLSMYYSIVMDIRKQRYILRFKISRQLQLKGLRTRDPILKILPDLHHFMTRTKMHNNQANQRASSKHITYKQNIPTLLYFS